MVWLYGFKSLERIDTNNHIVKERILKPAKDKRGYCFVGLYKDKKQKFYLVHQLVGKVFIPNPNNYPQINHKNESKTDNCVDNLEWCTNHYNANYGTRNERIGKANSITHKGLKLSEKHKENIGKSKLKPIVQIYKSGLIIGVYDSIKEAGNELCINSHNITNCLKGRYKSVGGFKWKYLNELKKAS